MLPLPWGWAVAPTPSASGIKVPEAAPYSFALEKWWSGVQSPGLHPVP